MVRTHPEKYSVIKINTRIIHLWKITLLLSLGK